MKVEKDFRKMPSAKNSRGTRKNDAPVLFQCDYCQCKTLSVQCSVLHCIPKSETILNLNTISDLDEHCLHELKPSIEL